MEKKVSYKKYLELVKEILTNNDDIISQQYIGLTESFYRENIQTWIRIYSNRNDYEKFIGGYLVFKGNVMIRENAKFFKENKEIMDQYSTKARSYYVALNDKQFLSLMIGKECIWYDETIKFLINKYEYKGA